MINNSPFEIPERVRVKGQKDVATRWLGRKERLALLRAVRQDKNQRALAIIKVMLGVSLRISETAPLKVSDIELNDRPGWVYIRTGQEMKPSSIPFSVHVRNALQDYLKVHPDEDEIDLFLGQRGPLSGWGDSRHREEVYLSGEVG